MELQYKGKNIYPSVKLKECIYDSRCDLQLSHLRIVFQDDNHKFDSYGFKLGDKIRVKDNYVEQDGRKVAIIHRRYSQRRVHLCYRELKPTIEWLEEAA